MSDEMELVEGELYTGTVYEFDEHVGLGSITVQTSQGELTQQHVPFHCVNIADGSRTTQINLRVSFRAYHHPIGGIEAKDIEPI